MDEEVERATPKVSEAQIKKPVVQDGKYAIDPFSKELGNKVSHDDSVVEADERNVKRIFRGKSVSSENPHWLWLTVSGGAGSVAKTPPLAARPEEASGGPLGVLLSHLEPVSAFFEHIAFFDLSAFFKLLHRVNPMFEFFHYIRHLPFFAFFTLFAFVFFLFCAISQVGSQQARGWRQTRINSLIQKIYVSV